MNRARNLHVPVLVSLRFLLLAYPSDVTMAALKSLQVFEPGRRYSKRTCDPKNVPEPCRTATRLIERFLRILVALAVIDRLVGTATSGSFENVTMMVWFACTLLNV